MKSYLRYLLPLFLLAAEAAGARAQSFPIYDSGGPLRPEQGTFDVTFYDIDLRILPDAKVIGGSVTTFARIVEPTRLIVLELDTLLIVQEVESVRGGEMSPLQWERRVGTIRIDLGSVRPAGEEVGVRVTYAGRPRVAPQAPWDGGFVWEETRSGASWIATAVQGEGPDLWWPAKDHVSDKPDSVALHIRVPRPLVVATNGRLERVEEHTDGTSTYHYLVSTPVSAYNIALNIAPYELIEEEMRSITGETFPVTFFVLPEDEGRGRRLMREILDHLRFFEETVGPYPFRADGYKVAQTPHLGMEHQTVIAYGANFNRGAMTGGRDWGFDALHHHELAHEWWGNLVTNSDWQDMWIHEGFGTYMQSLYAEELGGDEGYRAHLGVERQGISNLAPLAPRESKTTGEIYFDSGSDIYSKGAWVLHTLRWVLGDEDFFESLRRFAYPTEEARRATDGSQVRSVTSDDFIAVAEEVSGRELDWFFEVYLRQAQLPRITGVRAGEVLQLRWDAPGGLPFPMPVEVEFRGRTVRVEMPGGRGEVTLPRNAQAVVDPNSRVLRANQNEGVVAAQ